LPQLFYSVVATVPLLLPQLSTQTKAFAATVPLPTAVAYKFQTFKQLIFLNTAAAAF
jgi:hypothetical protein